MNQDLTPNYSKSPQDKINEIFEQLIEDVALVSTDLESYGQAQPKNEARLRNSYNKLRVVTASRIGLSPPLPGSVREGLNLIQNFMGKLMEVGFYNIGLTKVDPSVCALRSQSITNNYKYSIVKITSF